MRGEERTASVVHEPCQREIVVVIRTKHFPTFPEPLPVLRIDHVHDGVTVLVVSVPYRPNAPLTPKVEKVEDRRRERDLAD